MHKFTETMHLCYDVLHNFQKTQANKITNNEHKTNGHQENDPHSPASPKHSFWQNACFKS